MAKKKNKKVLNIVSIIIGIISLILMLVFSYAIYKLNMIPGKFLIPVYILIFIIYTGLLLTVFLPKVKSKIKVISIVVLVLFGVIFGFADKYIFTTLNFMDILDRDILQKERYDVYVLENSSYNKLEDLKGKKVGLYQSSNSEKAGSELKNKVNFEIIEYTDVEKMFESLNNDEINAIIISSSVKNLLDTELNDINVKIKSIYNFKISIEKNDIVKVVNVTNTPFNVYIAGGDGYGSIDYTFNTDVNMVATINPTTRKILLTSIPRDYYVNLVGQGPNAYDKLTHAGYYGIEESVKTVENLLDTDINYYVKINFSTIEGIVDAIGGIDVYSDFDFYEKAFGKYHFTVGYNHLDGKQALAFARERKSFAAGDVQRVKNQQKVVEAIINKVTSSTALISSYDRILDTVSENLDTNMPSKDISRLVKMQLNDMRGWTIKSQNAVGTSQMGPTYTFPTLNLYTMLPDEDSVNSLKAKINEYLGK
jgi:LCP family protein required for cell wall assembly